jgi:hypothetical protein
MVMGAKPKPVTESRVTGTVVQSEEERRALHAQLAEADEAEAAAAAEVKEDEEPAPAATLTPEQVEELDADEAEYRAMRLDVPGVKGTSSIGIVTISVGRLPTKNEYIRAHPLIHPVMRIVDHQVGMEKHFFAVTPNMVEPLTGIGITASVHVLYLTTTSQGAVRVIPIRQRTEELEQDEYSRTKEIGMMQAMHEWVRLYHDAENRAYKVFPAPAGRFGDPNWPELKEAKLFRLAFKDKGRLIDSSEHPLFLKWAGRDAE